MAIRFSCRSCGRQFAANNDQAGKSGRCPTCNTEIEVPRLETVTESVKGRPPPVPSIQIGDDWNPRPEDEEPLEIPGLQASPDDDYDEVPADVGGSRGYPSAPLATISNDIARHTPASKPTTSATGHPFPPDPWFYGLFQFAGVVTVGFSVMCFAFFFTVGLRSPNTGGSSLSAAVGLVIGGGAILLIVDVARNIRRLRLHADRNAGVE